MELSDNLGRQIPRHHHPLLRLLKSRVDHIAYLRVHSLAQSLYFPLSVLYNLAISGTRGSSGVGSQSRLQMDKSTFATVNAGDHCERRMSRQMAPLLLIFGW